MLQQCLPLAVLKQLYMVYHRCYVFIVATVLTACGIETSHLEILPWRYGMISVATVLTACGIET